jgi:hypothetical protein
MINNKNCCKNRILMCNEYISVEFSQTYGNRFNQPHFQPNFYDDIN